MSRGSGIVRPLVTALCVAVTVAGLLNVYGDNDETVIQAQTAACGAPDCTQAMTRMSRTPFAQSFTFQTRDDPKGRPAHSVDVSCSRQLVLVGEYTCKRETP